MIGNILTTLALYISLPVAKETTGDFREICGYLKWIVPAHR